MLDPAELADWATTLSLIFGGCMTNAVALEQCTVLLPRSGTLVTAMGFLAVSLCFLPSQLAFAPGQHRPRLLPRQVPLQRWGVQVALFFTTNLLNNLAFAFHVPMPVHIIFRSGGLVVNMILGWALAGKQYVRTSSMGRVVLPSLHRSLTPFLLCSALLCYAMLCSPSFR